MNSNDPQDLNDRHDLQTRLQETEIKLAFLEKEIAEYRDAVHTLHSRLETAERAVRRLQESGADKPENADLGEDRYAS